MTNASKLTSTDVKKLLLERHAGTGKGDHPDFIAFEVKTGSTWTKKANFGILDCWVMKKSWTRPRTIGYEIKVSRGDFLGDNKWPKYLPFCNEFYFICPADLIDKAELPPQVGLIYVTKNCKKLRTIKKAPHQQRNAEEQIDIYKYIIMHRLAPDTYPFHSDKTDYYEDWLANRISNQELGVRVGSKLALELRNAERVNKELKSKLCDLEEMEGVMKSYGLNVWNIEGRLLQQKGVNKFDLRNLDVIISTAKALKNKLTIEPEKGKTDGKSKGKNSSKK